MLLLHKFLLDFASSLGISSIVICSFSHHQDSDIQLHVDSFNIFANYGLGLAVDPCRTVDHITSRSIVWSLDISPLWISQNRHLVFLTPEDLHVKSKLMSLRLDSHLYSYNSDFDGNIKITEWYKVENRLFTKDLAIWSHEHGLSGLNLNIWSRSRRGNLQGMRLTNIAIPYSTETIVSPTGKITGYMAEIVSIMSAALNFTTVWKVRKQGDWGSFKNNSWTGLVGDLAYNKASFTSSALWYFGEQDKFIEYGLGIFDGSMTIGLSPLYGKVSKTKLNAQAYISVFEQSLWVMLGLISILTGIMYELLSRVASRYNSNGTLLFFEGIINFLTMLMQKNLVQQPAVLKYLWFLLQFCSMFVFFTYTSSLTALVTSKETIVKPRSFQDMLNMGIKVMLPPCVPTSLIYFEFLDCVESRFSRSEHVFQSPRGIHGRESFQKHHLCLFY